MIKMRNALLPILVICLSFFSCSCNLLGSSDSYTTNHKMYVYSNTAQKFYLFDYKTFEIVKEIPLDVPAGIELYGMEPSTNRDHLFFLAYGSQSTSPLGFAIYNINDEKFKDIYFTGFTQPGPVSFIATQDKSAPGTIFIHLRDEGTYIIDPLKRQVVEKISDEYAFSLSKRFKHSIDDTWSVVHKKWSGNASFSELEFYQGGTNLQNRQFTLNKNDTDSISIYDMAFSKENETLFITYQLSEGRSRDVESYFGSYNLQTGNLFQSELVFPWSLNPYYMTYSSKRNKVYTMGAYQEFHVIDTQMYEREKEVTLSEKKHPGPSRILLSPDQNFAFVSSPADNLLQVLNLNTLKLIQTIKIDEPYEMIIP